MEQTPGSTPGSTDIKGKAQETAQQAKSKAQEAAQRFKDEGKQQLETRKETAAHKAEQLADAVNRASDELHRQSEDGLADYASRLATGINQLADNLRNRSIDELMRDTQAFARRNPTMFFLSSIGVGFALSRFLKASSRRQTQPQSIREDDFEVSYDTGSEWRQPEASQSLYADQAGSSASDMSGAGVQRGQPSSWSAESPGNSADQTQSSSSSKPTRGTYPGDL